MIIDWLILTNKLTNWCTQMLMDGWWGVCVSELKGHAVAETPTAVARALLYIVRASPSFLLHPSYQSFYHTFHQVMSLDRRVYSFNKHFIVLYSCDRWPYMPHPSLPPAGRRPHGTTKCNVAFLRLPTIQHSAARCCPIPLSSWLNDNLILTMICPASHYSDVHAVNLNS